MTALRDRILAALALQPMTNTDVASLLSVTQQTAHTALVRLCERGQVRRRGWDKRRHRSGPLAQLFEVVA